MKPVPKRANVESLSELRDNLSEQYRNASAQRSSASSSVKRRRVGLAIAAALAIPASLAVAGEFSGEEHSFSWDGETLRMDGEVLECPVDSSVEAEVGFDPCQIFSPAPAPLDSRESGAGTDEPGPQRGSLKQVK